MSFFHLVVGILFMTFAAETPPDQHPQRVDGPTLHVVHLVGYTYEPANLIVQPGDTVRFVQESTLPHNVEFTDVPAGAALGDAKTGPYVIKSGDLYDLVIQDGFVRGNYSFHCTPHQTLGMKGTLTVRQGR